MEIPVAGFFAVLLRLVQGSLARTVPRQRRGILGHMVHSTRRLFSAEIPHLAATGTAPNQRNQMVREDQCGLSGA